MGWQALRNVLGNLFLARIIVGGRNLLCASIFSTIKSKKAADILNVKNI